MLRPRLKLLMILSLGYMIVLPRPAEAVIPPDFIFNIGAQFAQFFSIIILFLSTLVGTLWHFFKNRLYGIKHKKILLLGVIVIIIGSALVGSYMYVIYQQNASSYEGYNR